MSEAIVISANDAIIKTCSISVRVMTLNQKQVTLAVFRQLPNEPILDRVLGVLIPGSVPWGTINYHPDKCEKDSEHVHVVFQKEDKLKRCNLYKNGFNGFYRELDYGITALKIQLLKVLCLENHTTRIDSNEPRKLNIEYEQGKQQFKFVLNEYDLDHKFRSLVESFVSIVREIDSLPVDEATAIIEAIKEHSSGDYKCYEIEVGHRVIMDKDKYCEKYTKGWSEDLKRAKARLSEIKNKIRATLDKDIESTVPEIIEQIKACRRHMDQLESEWLKSYEWISSFDQLFIAA